MANIAIFKPNEQPQYLTSVSEGDYVVDINVDKRLQVPKDSTILINPDISSVMSIPLKYWKKVNNTVVEMTKVEKQAVDDVQKQLRIDAINNYQFEGGRLAEILVDEGIITKDKITDKIKVKEGR